ncbi:hypothetical protein B0H14DRAFT_3128435 [Mycena olivaceomarginata]|nr:hypothetical protein B0H14DRAFT_3128435 [Mycena olivaceomarginata]
MIAFKALFLAAPAPLFVFAASVLGTDVTARQVDATRYVSVALEHFEPNATALQKRDTIQDYSKPGTPVSNRFLLGPNLRSIGTSIASESFVESRSEAHDCRVYTGAIDAAQWRYYSVSTNGGYDTTAALTTIRGTIDAFLEEYVNGWCSNVCLRMSHFGAWTVYLSVSPVGSLPPADCGTDDYDTCETHGDEADLGARNEYQVVSPNSIPSKAAGFWIKEENRFCCLCIALADSLIRSLRSWDFYISRERITFALLGARITREVSFDLKAPELEQFPGPPVISTPSAVYGF